MKKRESGLYLYWWRDMTRTSQIFGLQHTGGLYTWCRHTCGSCGKTLSAGVATDFCIIWHCRVFSFYAHNGAQLSDRCSFHFLQMLLYGVSKLRHWSVHVIRPSFFDTFSILQQRQCDLDFQQSSQARDFSRKSLRVGSANKVEIPNRSISLEQINGEDLVHERIRKV